MKSCQIDDGSYCSVCSHGGLVYAALSQSSELRVYRHDGGTWQRVTSQQLPLQHQQRGGAPQQNVTGTHSDVRLHVSGDKLLCGNSSSGGATTNDVIYCMSLNGTEWRACGETFTAAATAATQNNDSVVLTDKLTHTLHMMTEQGETTTLQLQPHVSQPSSALLHNASLYVTGGGASQNTLLYKYSQQLPAAAVV